MNGYIDAEALKEKYTMVIKRYSGGIMERPAVLLETIDDAPHINLADYVPKDFHDKTCEAMAKAHQEEIADMVRVVRCKECRFGQWHEQAEEYICIVHDQDLFDGDHFCSYGERESE